jgi:hypothetical protein
MEGIRSADLNGRVVAVEAEIISAKPTPASE